MRPLRGGLMVCGTQRGAGKSTIVAGLCRLLAREGLRVAPFKAHSFVRDPVATAEGGMVSRALACQAAAAGVLPEIAMNPLVTRLGPPGTQGALVAQTSPGRRIDSSACAADFEARFEVVTSALASLRRRFDVVVVEGCGSAAEMGRLRHDVGNLRLADAADLAAVLVGDASRGGLHASLYGTAMLVPPAWRERLVGFLANRAVDDLATRAGFGHLSRLTGIPELGLLPELGLSWSGVAVAEQLDTTSRFAAGPPTSGDRLDVVVVALPELIGIDGIEALAAEPGVAIRLIDNPASIGRPDLVILPSTGQPTADLSWLRERGFPRAISASDAEVVGVGGGFCMLAETLEDPDSPLSTGAEPPATPALSRPTVGLGWLPLHARRVPRGLFAPSPAPPHDHFAGMQLQVQGHDGRAVVVAPRPALVTSGDGRVRGTLGGVLEDDGRRWALLEEVAARRGKRFVAGEPWEVVRLARLDHLADWLAANLRPDLLDRIVGARG